MNFFSIYSSPANSLNMRFSRLFLNFTFLLLALTIKVASAATLVGWSSLAKNTYTAGPFQQHQPGKNWAAPSAQMVGGFSAGVKAKDGNFIFMTDTGYGPQASSFSSLLGFYELKIDYNDFNGQNRQVSVLNQMRITDPDHKLSFSRQADFEFYGNNSKNNRVDGMIKKDALLTGGDLDTESFRVDYKGNIWVGEEFGPFLIKLDNTGKVLAKQISVPGVTSPDNPLLKPDDVPNTKTSTGFEGMAINPKGNKLYPMLEKPVIQDEAKTLRIYTYDIDVDQFEDGYFLYQLNGRATEIREFVAINDHEFLTVEQNEHFGSPEGQVKKVYLVSIAGVDKLQYVKKTELVDLMNIDDPVDLNRDHQTSFAFPKLTIETIVVLDKDTLLIVNDNNLEERTEFIKVRLNIPLKLAQFDSPLLDTSGWAARDNNYYAWQGFHTKSLEWFNIGLIGIVLLLAGYITTQKVRLADEGLLYWGMICCMLLVYFFYNYLSLYYYATQSFRDIFADLGMYQNRRPLQQAMISALAFGIALLAFAVLMLFKNRYTKYTMFVFTLLLGLKGVQFVSYHRVDRVMEHTLGPGRVFDWLECVGIILLLMAIAYEGKNALHKHKSHSSQSY